MLGLINLVATMKGWQRKTLSEVLEKKQHVASSSNVICFEDKLFFHLAIHTFFQLRGPQNRTSDLQLSHRCEKVFSSLYMEQHSSSPCDVWCIYIICRVKSLRKWLWLMQRLKTKQWLWLMQKPH